MRVAEQLTASTGNHWSPVGDTEVNDCARRYLGDGVEVGVVAQDNDDPVKVGDEWHTCAAYLVIGRVEVAEAGGGTPDAALSALKAAVVALAESL